MSRLHVLSSERNYISKEPIATCISIEDAKTLNGTLIEGKIVGGLFEWRMSPAGLSPRRREMTGWTLKPTSQPATFKHERQLFEGSFQSKKYGIVTYSP